MGKVVFPEDLKTAKAKGAAAGPVMTAFGATGDNWFGSAKSAIALAEINQETAFRTLTDEQILHGESLLKSAACWTKGRRGAGCCQLRGETERIGEKRVSV
jgi:hypothetical protein